MSHAADSVARGRARVSAEDPVTYLGNLLDRCMMFRSGLTDPPLLFTNTHIQAMYRALDPHNTGHITRQQYEAGLRSMNIVGYEAHPILDEEGMVEKEVFTTEALDCLTRSLLAMLRVGDVSAPSTAWKIPILTVISPTESALERAAEELDKAAEEEAAAKAAREATLPLPPPLPTAPGYVPPRLCNVPNIEAFSPSDHTGPDEADRKQPFMPGYVPPPPHKVGLGPVDPDKKKDHSLLLPELEEILTNIHEGPDDKISQFPPKPVCEDSESERVVAEHLPTYDDDDDNANANADADAHPAPNT